MHKLFMHLINTLMKTYTALIKATVNGNMRAVPTQIRALNPTDARWLLQAIYGFHSLVSPPTEVAESEAISEIITRGLLVFSAISDGTKS
jgi:hypothetical protein